MGVGQVLASSRHPTSCRTSSDGRQGVLFKRISYIKRNAQPLMSHIYEIGWLLLHICARQPTYDNLMADNRPSKFSNAYISSFSGQPE